MIITNNEEILRAPCEEVKTEEVAELIQALQLELDNSARLGRPGIGLAAPQIGIHKKIAIVRLNHNLKLDLVNAKIDRGYDEQLFRSEGCLSFPGRIEDTMRYQEIHVSNNLVYPHNFIATGLLAVVISHELDHINGILLPDRAIVKKPIIKIGPNDFCICGSKKKYKKCCSKL